MINSNYISILWMGGVCFWAWKLTSHNTFYEDITLPIFKTHKQELKSHGRVLLCVFCMLMCMECVVLWVAARHSFDGRALVLPGLVSCIVFQLPGLLWSPSIHSFAWSNRTTIETHETIEQAVDQTIFPLRVRNIVWGGDYFLATITGNGPIPYCSIRYQ